MKLGRVHSQRDSRTLEFLRYAPASKLPVPPARQLLETTTSWPMLANDRFNCCTSAAAGHMVHHWTAANKNGIFLTDDDIIRAHAQLTGERLMDCVSMLDALKFWRNAGIGNHRIASFLAASPADPDQLRCIVHLFGSAYIGLDLPNFVCAGPPLSWPQTPWIVSSTAQGADLVPRDANGHCVTAVGYSEEGVYVVTWGTFKTMSWDFYQRYNVETYAILSTDWVKENEACPSGFLASTLRRDLHVLDHSGTGENPKPRNQQSQSSPSAVAAMPTGNVILKPQATQSATLIAKSAS